MHSKPLTALARAFPIVAVSALVLLGCSRPAPPQEPVRAVKLLTVGTSPLLSSHEFAGEVRARTESRLGFRVAGKITRRPAEVGQRVKAGQLLAQLDAQDLKLATEAAGAQAAAARTQRDLAAADFKRFAALREQNFISGAELERRESALKAAQAQLDAMSAQLAAQSNQARYANLVAEVPGVITAVEAEPGQVVSAGMPVVRIAQDGPRDIVFAVPEDKVGAMKQGSVVVVRVWAGGRTLAGRVREVAASADPVTRTFVVKVALDDAGSPPPLGATANVTPSTLGARGAVAIKLPTSALRQEGPNTAVWVLDSASMTVKSQTVQIATADGNEAVIAGGLEPGMRVVSAGVHVLSPGQKVSVYQERPAQPGAAAAALPPRAGLAGAAQAATPAPARSPP